MGYKEIWIDELEDMDDDDLIEELENRGFVVAEKTAETDLFKIRQAYLLDSPEDFRKFLEKLFEENEMPV